MSTTGEETANPLACVDCHAHDHVAAADPRHTGAGGLGFSTDCASCHGKDSWHPATWHHPSKWPLVGKHIGVKCSACHSVGPKPPSSCDGCHMSDYQATKNPNHVAANYPKACANCHTPAGWKPAKGLQHKFPITKGKHKHVACATCHIDPDNYSNFSCMTGACHPKSKMDDKHIGEDDAKGYKYEAKACLKCHPDGKEE